jgi:hypothetical protein
MITLQLYIAYTDINRGMTSSGQYSYGSPGHIAMPANKCGAIFKYTVASTTYTATAAEVRGRQPAKGLIQQCSTLSAVGTGHQGKLVVVARLPAHHITSCVPGQMLSLARYSSVSMLSHFTRA